MTKENLAQKSLQQAVNHAVHNGLYEVLNDFRDRLAQDLNSEEKNELRVMLLDMIKKGTEYFFDCRNGDRW